MISIFPELDPLLFDYRGPETQPILNPLAQKQFQMALGEICRVVPTRWCILTGDALRSSNPQSLLKVVIGIKEQDFQGANSGYMFTVLGKILAKLNNSETYVQGTQHPVKYIIVSNKYDDYNFRDAYALLDDRWLKCSYTPPMIEKIEIKRPTNKRQYMQNIFRGLNRKNPDYIPDIYKKTQYETTHAKIPLEAAKRGTSGMWRLSRFQAMEIARKYHLTHLPKKRKPYKMLGNTGVMLFRPGKEKFFLIKGPYTKKIKKAFRNVVYA
jgi:hypothetical protein